MSKRRPISAVNRMFLFLSGLLNGNSCDLVELAGFLDEQRLRQAIDVVLAKHPPLNSRLRRHWLDYAWEEADEPLPVDFQIHRYQGDPAGLHQHLMDLVWRQPPLDLYAGRPIRFHLTETDQGSVLQIISSHVWHDARAGHRLVADIANAYTALSEGREPDAQVLDVADRDSTRLFAGRLPKPHYYYWLQAARSIVSEFLAPDKSMGFRGPRGQSDVRLVDFGEELMTRLRKSAKAAGVTLHTLLNVALLRTCQRQRRNTGLPADGTYRLLDMYSLRSFSRQNVNHLYDCMVMPFSVRQSLDVGDAELAMGIARQLGELKRGEIMVELFRQRLYSLSAALLPKRLATAMVAQYVHKGGVSNTNPGRIRYTIEHFGEVGVREYYSFSQVFPPSRLMTQFNIYRGRLRAVVTYDTAAFPGDALDRFLGEFQEKLEELASHPPVGVVGEETPRSPAGVQGVPANLGLAASRAE